MRELLITAEIAAHHDCLCGYLDSMDREMMMKDLEAWFFSYVKYDLSDYNQEAHARHIEEFQAIKELIGSIHRLKC